MTSEPDPDRPSFESPDQQSLSPADFTPQEEIGRTATSVVYRVATNSSLGDVAIKHPALHHTPEVGSLTNEAKQWAQLDDHAHIVGVVDWDTTQLSWVHSDGEIPWIAMEYMDGGDLTEYAGDLSVEASVWIAERLADAVWYAHHHGIGGVHHDLKPANILFQTSASGEWPVPKVSDWELARTLLNHSNSVGVTTPPYIAPEQARNEETNQWTDQFQLGIVLFELFTGSHPFVDDDKSVIDITYINAIKENDPEYAAELRPEVPAEIDAVLQKMLAKDPQDRFEAMLEVRNKFQSISSADEQMPTVTTSQAETVVTDRNEQSTSRGSDAETDRTHRSEAYERVVNSRQWPMFQGGPARTGSQSTVGPKDSLEEQWRFTTEGEVFSSPAVGSDAIYVGSKDDYVYAIDRETGEQQWLFGTHDAVFSSPATTGETVYVGSNDGTVYAIDAIEGSEDWAFKTNGRVRSSPAVTQGSVYVGSWDNRIYAIDKHDGGEQWAYETYGDVDSSAVVVDGTVYICCRAGAVYALNSNNGGQRWRPVETTGEIFSSPVVADGSIYVGSRDGHLYAIARDDGTKQWSFETKQWIESSPAVVDGTVYIGGRDGDLYAIDTAEGKKIWAYEARGEIFSTPAVADGIVYIASFYQTTDESEGHIYAIDAEQGNRLAHASVDDRILSSPAVADGCLYVGSHDGNVYSFAKPD